MGTKGTWYIVDTQQMVISAFFFKVKRNPEGKKNFLKHIPY